MNDKNYIIEQIKRSDYEQYIISLFIDEDIRYDLLVIILLQNELFNVYKSVKEPILGLVRLQWWQEAIEKIYNQQDYTNNPLLKSLNITIAKYDIPFSYFDKLITAHKLYFDHIEHDDKWLNDYLTNINDHLSNILFSVLQANNNINISKDFKIIMTIFNLTFIFKKCLYYHINIDKDLIKQLLIKRLNEVKHYKASHLILINKNFLFILLQKSLTKLYLKYEKNNLYPSKLRILLTIFIAQLAMRI